jgi:hemin uptake protein HemP
MNPLQARDDPPGGRERIALPGRPPLLDSAQLLQGHRTVEIQHNGELYRLQATRTGKLILTK